MNLATQTVILTPAKLLEIAIINEPEFARRPVEEVTERHVMMSADSKSAN